MKAPTLIKVGGNEVDDPAWTRRLAEAVAAAEGPTVIVHGGGKEVTEVQRLLGAEPEWKDGLRVTTPEALRAVQMVLSGVVNKRLVSALVTAGAMAVGISGEDGGLLQAVPAQGGRLGRTGEIAGVTPDVLHRLLEMDIVPVVSPVSRGPDGGALNVNADDAASALASALGCRRFLMVSNVPGVLANGDVLGNLTVDGLETLIAEGTVSGGMIPKVRAAMRAAGGGVAEVRIGDLGMFVDRTSGTSLVA